MSNLTLKNFGQSKSNLENLIDSTDDEELELDDAALLAVNGGVTSNANVGINANTSFNVRYASNLQVGESVIAWE